MLFYQGRLTSQTLLVWFLSPCIMLAVLGCGKKNSSKNEVTPKPAPISLVCETPETCSQERPKAPVTAIPPLPEILTAELLSQVPEDMVEIAKSLYLFSTNDPEQFYFFPKTFVPEERVNSSLNLPKTTVHPQTWDTTVELALLSKDSSLDEGLALKIAIIEKNRGIRFAVLPTTNLTTKLRPKASLEELKSLSCEDKFYSENILDKVQVFHPFSLNYKHCRFSSQYIALNANHAASLPIATLKNSFFWGMNWKDKAFASRLQLDLYPEVITDLGEALFNKGLLNRYDAYAVATHIPKVQSTIPILIETKPYLLAGELAKAIKAHDSQPYLKRPEIKALISSLLSCTGEACVLGIWQLAADNLKARLKPDLNTTARSLDFVTDVVVRQYFGSLLIVNSKEEDKKIIGDEEEIFFLSEDMTRFNKLEEIFSIDLPSDPQIENIHINSSIDLSCLFFGRYENADLPGGFSIKLALSETCPISKGVF